MHLKSLVAVCMLGLFVMIEVIEGVPIEPDMPRCMCRQLSAAHIKRDLIKKIEMFPARNYCPMMEVVVTIKDNIRICVDPNTKWFTKLLPKRMQKLKEKQE